MHACRDFEDMCIVWYSLRGTMHVYDTCMYILLLLLLLLEALCTSPAVARSSVAHPLV